MFNRGIENGVIQQSKQKGVGMVGFSPLAQGLLSSKYLGGIPENSRAADPDGFLQADEITDKRLKQVQELQDLASERGQSLPRLALQWCLRHKTMATVIIGASRVEQIKENIEMLEDPDLSEEFCLRIDSILEED